MSLSSLPLSYCTNVHAGRSVGEVEAGLDQYTVRMAERFGEPLAAGLWLARPVIDELLAGDALPRFAAGLARRGLTSHTLNAFPYGDFHSTRVKENVYLPDWADPKRLRYTQQCAAVLARLLGENDEGSISTVPLGFKGFDHAGDFVDRCIAQLIELARDLDSLRYNTGKTIRLAIEPEPMCVLETTDETLEFFRKLRDAAARAHATPHVEQHLGVCYDVCHQAVEFEDVTASIQSLDREGIRINKVHISCALQLDEPAQNVEGREALKRYAEPRYLHQTTAPKLDGTVARHLDLSPDLIDHAPADFRDAARWRIHFHVPVDAEDLGPLSTTRPALRDALAAVARLAYAPHLEVETYTWEVLPGAGQVDLVEGLTREMTATRALLRDYGGRG